MQVLLNHPSASFTPQSPTSSARRNLFGRPSEGQENYVKQLLADLTEKQNIKWEFDFAIGQPLTKPKDSGMFVYTQLSEEQVPGFYRISTYTQSRPQKALSSRFQEEDNVENMDPQRRASAQSSSSSLLNDSTSSSSNNESMNVSLEEQATVGGHKKANEQQQMDTTCNEEQQSGSGEGETQPLRKPTTKHSTTAVTPKKQAKLTDFMPQRRKNLQRSAKKSDWKTKRENGCECCPGSPLISPTKNNSVIKRRSTVGARLAAASLRTQ